MAAEIKAPESDGVAVVEVALGEKGIIVGEKQGEIGTENNAPAALGQESFGAPPDNEVQYVKGHPVIRSGN